MTVVRVSDGYLNIRQFGDDAKAVHAMLRWMADNSIPALLRYTSKHTAGGWMTRRILMHRLAPYAMDTAANHWAGYLGSEFLGVRSLEASLRPNDVAVFRLRYPIFAVVDASQLEKETMYRLQVKRSMARIQETSLKMRQKMFRL